MKKKFFALCLALAMAVTCFTACNKDETVQSGELGKVTTTDTYPQETDVTLRHWGVLDSGLLSSCTNYGETDMAKWLEEETGIKVKYEHPVAGQEEAAFNIMISSDDMPDLINWQWTTYPGGPDKAIEEGIITRLNDYFEKVSPNLMKLLDEHPEWNAAIMTDAGNYFQYPMIKEDNKLLTYFSYFIRKDLLDKAGMDVPVTLADWEKVLYKFRDMGVEVPLSVRINNDYIQTFGPFMGCFGIMGDFYQMDGKVKFGPYEEAFRDYVELLAKWYKDGILDKEFADTDSKRRAALASNGRVGAIEGTIGGDCGRWLSAITPESGIELIPVTVPVLNEGDRPMWTQATPAVGSSTAIAASSKHKELAARYLDYGYSQEGYILNNFGKENVTFTMKEKDGRMIPTYMDWMYDSEKNGGFTFSECLAFYTRANGGPCVQSVDYIEQNYSQKIQRDALNKVDSDVLKYMLPEVYMTNEEQKTYSDIMTPVNTYRDETIAKIISGKMPLGELDNYYAQLKKLGIEKAIEIKQAAYDRYLERLG